MSDVESRRGWSKAKWDAWYAEQRQKHANIQSEDDFTLREELDLVARVVTKFLPGMSREAVISKLLEEHPEQFYAADMPPAATPKPISKLEQMPAGVAALVDELTRRHPQLSREQALLHVLNQTPELYELRWAQHTA